MQKSGFAGLSRFLFSLRNRIFRTGKFSETKIYPKCFFPPVFFRPKDQKRTRFFTLGILGKFLAYFDFLVTILIINTYEGVNVTFSQLNVTFSQECTVLCNFFTTFVSNLALRVFFCVTFAQKYKTWK